MTKRRSRKRHGLRLCRVCRRWTVTRFGREPFHAYCHAVSLIDYAGIYWRAVMR